MTEQKRFIVLGAGPAGLSAAYHLVERGYHVEVIEREERVGGLGASFRWGDFILDFGPHAFHVKPTPSMDLVKKLFAEQPEELIFQYRNELLLVRRKFFRYPMQFYELLRKLNPLFTLNLVFDFLMSSLIYRYIAVPDDNFESWCIKRFGKSLYQLCFGNYTAKVWGMPSARISPKFAARKIHKLNLKDIVYKLLGGKGEEQETYWKDLAYPRYGSGQLFERLASAIAARGGTIHLGSRLEKIDVDGHRAKRVTVSRQGQSVEIPCDVIVSSIPIQGLVNALQPPLGEYVSYTARLLKYRSLIVVYLGFDQEQVLPAHWIYLLDTVFKFNRITEQKNMSAATCPAERSVISCERGCFYGDALWNSSDEDLYRQALDDLSHIPMIDRTKISSRCVGRIRDAYPVYDLDFDKNLRAVLDGLSRIENLYSFGRQGLFLQNDMHDSMEMGRLVAEKITGEKISSGAWYEYMLDYWKLSDRQPLF